VLHLPGNLVHEGEEMTSTADILRTYLDYTAWASRRLVEAAASLSPEELKRDFGTANQSVLGTLVHVFAADRVWLSLIQRNEPAKFLDPEKDIHLEVLQSDWPALLERWKQWAANLTDDGATAGFPLRTPRGDVREITPWQIIMHVVNHGSHHRGLVSGFLRILGRTPPPLDLMAYYREKS
jgi:uncharacterized damage-inducible protein DinB